MSPLITLRRMMSQTPKFCSYIYLFRSGNPHQFIFHSNVSACVVVAGAAAAIRNVRENRIMVSVLTVLIRTIFTNLHVRTEKNNNSSSSSNNDNEEKNNRLATAVMNAQFSSVCFCGKKWRNMTEDDLFMLRNHSNLCWSNCF